MCSDVKVGINVPCPPSEQAESIFPILSPLLVGNCPLLGLNATPFPVPITACHFLHSAHRCSPGEHVLLCFLHTNVLQNLVLGEPSIISQSHSEGLAFKWWFLFLFFNNTRQCTRQWNDSFTVFFTEYSFSMYHSLWTLPWWQVSDKIGRKDPENILRRQ